MGFPLKFKIGLYAAIISGLALALTPSIIQPFIYHRQVQELDTEMRRDADEIFEVLSARIERGVDPRKPLTRESIPQSLRGRFIRIANADGSELYRSGNWKDFEPRTLQQGGATIRISDRNSRIVTVRNGAHVVNMGTRLGTIEGMQQDLRFAFAVALPAVFLLTLAGALWVARRALRPVAEMTAAAERINVKRPDERLPVPDSGDEIERLSHVLNASFDRLEKAYAAAERFSSAASHQFKTPLTILRAGLGELRGCDYLKPSEREMVESLLQQTRRLTTLCDDLLLLAQADAGRLDIAAEPVDVVPLLSGAIDDAEVLGMERRIVIEQSLPAELLVLADSRRLAVILQNICENAVKYNRPDGFIKINAASENGKAVISVTNSGPCVPPADAERIFERFNRGLAEENHKGHGLGLSIARELARAHGGDLRLKRSDAEGTEFELVLPLAPATA